MAVTGDSTKNDSFLSGNSSTLATTSGYNNNSSIPSTLTNPVTLASGEEKALDYDLVGGLSRSGPKQLTDVIVIGVVCVLVLLCVAQLVFSTMTVYVFCKSRSRVRQAEGRAGGRIGGNDDVMKMKAAAPPAAGCFTTRSESDVLSTQIRIPRFVPRPSLAFLSQRDSASTSLHL
jgi:hypothetical protein